MRSLVIFSAGAILALAPQTAHAQDSAIELSWPAPEACPDADAMRLQIAQIAGETDPTWEPIEVSATFAHDAEAEEWSLRLQTLQAGLAGERVFRGPDCGLLVSAAAYVVALALNPEATLVTTPEPTPEPEPEQVVLPSTALSLDSSLDWTRDHADTPLHFGLQSAFLLDVGTLPQTAPGLCVGVGLEGERWRANLNFLFLSAQKEQLTNHPSATGSISLIGAILNARWSLIELGTFEVGPVAGVEVSSLFASSEGVTNPGTGSALWLAFSAGAIALVRLADIFALSLEIAALVPVFRPLFTIDGVGEVHKPALLSGRLAVGAELRF